MILGGIFMNTIYQIIIGATFVGAILIGVFVGNCCKGTELVLVDDTYKDLYTSLLESHKGLQKDYGNLHERFMLQQNAIQTYEPFVEEVISHLANAEEVLKHAENEEQTRNIVLAFYSAVSTTIKEFNSN
jgi:hypothetical protein